MSNIHLPNKASQQLKHIGRTLGPNQRHNTPCRKQVFTLIKNECKSAQRLLFTFPYQSREPALSRPTPLQSNVRFNINVKVNSSFYNDLQTILIHFIFETLTVRLKRVTRSLSFHRWVTTAWRAWIC